VQIDMLPLLAKVLLFWTLELLCQPPEELHRAKVACIQDRVFVRYQHTLTNLQQLSPKRQAPLAAKHAFARNLAIDVANPRPHSSH
jgi:hypothetical protein